VRRSAVVIPRAILFDFGGTLDAARLTWKERLFGLCRARRRRHAGPVRPLFYGARRRARGAIPATLSLDETVRRLVAGLGTALGLADERLVDRIATVFLDQYDRAVRDNVSSLSPLASRYRLGIVSNFTQPRDRL